MADARIVITDPAIPAPRKSAAAESLICTGPNGIGFAGHHWEISNVRIDGASFYHHLCLRCAAQKDVPLDTPSGNPWPKPGNAKAARA